MEATLECARAGVTTGEWSEALREVFGEFRAPTGVSSAPVAVTAEEGTALALVRRKVEETARELGVGKLRFLVGKPGLDGHSNGAEDRRARPRRRVRGGDQGIRLTPEQIVTRPSPRTCTASVCPSAPARTPSWCPTCWSDCARPARPTSR